MLRADVDILRCLSAVAYATAIRYFSLHFAMLMLIFDNVNVHATVTSYAIYKSHSLLIFAATPCHYFSIPALFRYAISMMPLFRLRRFRRRR